MTAVCTTPSREPRGERLARWWALHTEWLEWPFTTKREMRRRTSQCFQSGFQSGVERTVEAAQKVGQR